MCSFRWCNFCQCKASAGKDCYRRDKINLIYCRDCNPIRQKIQSSPNRPICLNDLLEYKALSVDEVKDIAQTLVIAESIVGKRGKKKELEIKFFGIDDLQWLQSECTQIFNET